MEINDDWIARVMRDYPPLLTKSELSGLTRRHERTIQRMIASGEIAVLRTCETGSGRVLIPREVAAEVLRRMAGL